MLLLYYYIELLDPLPVFYKNVRSENFMSAAYD